MSEPTVFSKIISGEISTDFVYEDEHCVCIKDLHPQAPIHLLIIPRKPIPRVVDAVADDKMVLGHLLLKAGEIACQLGVGDAFRLIINNGEGAGQTVFHLHVHLLAEKEFAEGSMSL